MESLAPRKALITGITGQDGSYLTELLLEKGYQVFGMARHVSPENNWRITHLLDRVQIHRVDLQDPDAINALLSTVQPDECYHLAGETQLGWDEASERRTLTLNILGTHHLLAAIRSMVPACRVALAGSSEVFGGGTHTPQNEGSRFLPRSVYGVSKEAVTQLAQIYRRAHGLRVSTAILYNHESPRRGEGFVTRKISLGVARIKSGLATELRLGNIQMKRDWGHARCYVEGMWRMLQYAEAEDFILATGEMHTVEDFVNEAFGCVGLDPSEYLVVDPALFRPLEAQVELRGDASKAHRLLAWTPAVTFQQLVREMVESDLAALAKG